MKRFLPYGRQSINEEDLAAVNDALRGDIITRGKHVEAFEKALAQRCGASHAIAFQSGTAALQAACFAGQLSAHDDVYTTPNSFFATAGAPLQCGSRPIFIDIDRDNGNLDLEQLVININQRRSRGRDVIMPVHFSGIPVDMQQLSGAITNSSTLVIEDAAHALGSYYSDGSPVGSCRWSDMTILSFHPVKAITCGEGGAVTTNDDTLAHQLRRFRNNGIERDPAHLLEQAAPPWYYEVHAVTGNYNVTDFQAALGFSQLSRLDLFVAKRRQLMLRYRSHFQRTPLIRLFSNAGADRTAYHLCVVQINFAACKISKEQLVEKLYRAGIGVQIHYIPIYSHPRMREVVGDIAEFFPNMEAYYASALSLPLFYGLELEEVDYVAKTLLEFLQKR